MSLRYALALSAAALLLLWNLNYAPVFNPDEGRYISASLEMIAPLDGSAPDWIVPHLNTIPRLNKPPLVYWSAATFFQMFGPSVVAARLAPALASVGVLLLVFLLGTKMFGRRAGVLGAVVWATSALPFVLGRMLSTDMLLTFSMTLGLFGLYAALAASQEGQKKVSYFMLAGIGLGLAILAKGPVGLALPLLIAFVWMLLVAGGRTFRVLVVAGVLAAMMLAVIIASPWYMAIAREHPEFLGRFLWGENVARLTGSTAYHDPKPIWFYLPVLIAGALPWTAFLWPAARALLSDLKNRLNSDENGSYARSRLFLWIWACAVVALFSMSSTKLITYILPAFPALALLIAQVFAPHTSLADVRRRALKQASSATIALCAFLGILLPLLFLHPKLLADKILPTEVAAPYVLFVGAVFLCGAILIWWQRRTASTLALIGALFFLTLPNLMGVYSLYEDPSPMFEKLQPSLQPTDRIVQFKTFQPSLMFYTKRPSTIIDFVNTSGLDEDEFANSGRFVQTHDEIKKLAAGEDRIFVLTRWKHVHWPTLPKMYTLAINNDYRLLSNRPAPAGYKYEFIAPRKRNRELSPACKALAPDC